MILIVGMGLTGITIADQIVKYTEHEVLMIERENHYGGLHYEYCEKDIIVNENGHHIFSSDDKELWMYVNEICDWNIVRNSREAFHIDNKYIPSKLSCEQVNALFDESITNEDDLEIFMKKDTIHCSDKSSCEDVVLSTVGFKIYNHLYGRHLQQTWRTNPLRLHKRVGDKVINNITSGPNSKKYIGFPKEGYARFFEKILSNRKIKYLLNMDYTSFCSNNDISEFTHIIYTGKLDDYSSDLKLNYIGYKNTNIVHTNYYQPYSIVNYVSGTEKYDRIIEHKHFSLLTEHNRHSVITCQQITDNCVPFFPIETIENVYNVSSYMKQHISKKTNVYFVGRLAEYRNMDTSEIIRNALDFYKELFPSNVIVTDIEYSHSIKDIYNYNIKKSINTKISNANSLLREAYKLNMNRINHSEMTFQLKSHLKFNMETINNHIIVVSRYNENVDWLNRLIEQHSWINKIIVFNKGLDEINNKYTDIIEIVNLSNKGREGETYLNYIINNYDSLPEHIWFIQANPFDHSPDIINLFSYNSVSQYNSKYQGLTYRYLKNIPQNIENDNRFFVNSNRTIDYFIDKVTQQVVDIHSFHDKSHERKVLNMEQKYDTNMFDCYYDYLCDYIGIDKPSNNIIGYTWAAMFYVNKSQILKHKHDVYEKLRNKLLEYDEQGGDEGYMLERIWHYIFTNKSYLSVQEMYKYNNLKSFVSICGCFFENVKTLFIFDNENNQNSDIGKTGTYDETKRMLYIDTHDNSKVICVESTRFNGRVIDKIPCQTLSEAEQGLIDYFVVYTEEQSKQMLIHNNNNIIK